MTILDLGKKNYKETWDIQKTIVEKVQEKKLDNTLIFVEHNDVFTFGKRGKTENLKVKEETLKKLGFDIFVTERGGDVTYHGPGQLVIYPIYDIKSHFTGVKKFVMDIETTLIETLKAFGINAHGDEKTVGAWIGNDKISAIGIAFKRHVSFHGTALNVNTDLSKFNYIIPCGLDNKGVTSMEKILKRKIPLNDVKKVFIEKWLEIFREKEVKYISEKDIWKENPNG